MVFLLPSKTEEKLEETSICQHVQVETVFRDSTWWNWCQSDSEGERPLAGLLAKLWRSRSFSLSLSLLSCLCLCLCLCLCFFFFFLCSWWWWWWWWWCLEEEEEEAPSLANVGIGVAGMGMTACSMTGGSRPVEGNSIHHFFLRNIHDVGIRLMSPVFLCHSLYPDSFMERDGRPSFGYNLTPT